MKGTTLPLRWGSARIADSTALVRSLGRSAAVARVSAPRSVITTLLLAPVLDRIDDLGLAERVAGWRPSAGQLSVSFSVRGFRLGFQTSTLVGGSSSGWILLMPFCDESFGFFFS